MDVVDKLYKLIEIQGRCWEVHSDLLNCNSCPLRNDYCFDGLNRRIGRSSTGKLEVAGNLLLQHKLETFLINE
jgi:hypothetical protein